MELIKQNLKELQCAHILDVLGPVIEEVTEPTRVVLTIIPVGSFKKVTVESVDSKLERAIEAYKEYS